MTSLMDDLFPLPPIIKQRLKFKIFINQNREIKLEYLIINTGKLNYNILSNLEYFGKAAIAGAKAGRAFGEDNKGNAQELVKINDFEWLKNQFETLYLPSV